MRRAALAAIAAVSMVGASCSSDRSDGPEPAGGRPVGSSITTLAPAGDQAPPLSTAVIDPSALSPERLGELERQLDDAELQLDELERRTPFGGG